MSKLIPADDEAKKIVKRVLAEHTELSGLVEAEVTVDTLFCVRGDKDMFGALKGPGGYEIEASVKQTNHEQRVKGNADIVLTLDADKWDNLPDDRKREAVVYKQLSKLVVRSDKKGEPRVDKGGRPVVGVRRVDYFVELDTRVIDKFGSDAPELRITRKMAEYHGPQLFPWVNDWGDVDLSARRPSDAEMDDPDEDDLFNRVKADDPDEDDESESDSDIDMESDDEGGEDEGGETLPIGGPMSEDPVFAHELAADGGEPKPAKAPKSKAPKSRPAKTKEPKPAKAPKSKTAKPRGPRAKAKASHALGL